ncbi:MAG: acetyl-CoA C-acyltransferase [Candidatus Aminicenantes bacterium]|nr:MAG: acetyl-CoA C-acyltransferase [Candidatus Aminicenantes bacterium]
MNKQLNDAYIVSAVRTPVGRAPRGMFKHVRPDDLLAHSFKGLLEKTSNLDPHDIDDVIAGCAVPEGEQGADVARVAVLLAGIPVSVPGVTVNRFCSSGLQAVAMAADRIRVGEADIMIAGGVESMSMVPMYGNKPSFNPEVFNHENTLGMTYSMGIGAELIAKERNIDREAQDEFALQSHQRALAAIEKGKFKDEILPFEITHSLPDRETGKVRETKHTVDSDEGPRPDTSLEALGKLRPAFAAGGTVTAGNSSQMSDGAAAVLLCSEHGLKKLNLEPMARFLGFGAAGVKPELFSIGPVKAIPKVLKRTGLKLGDIGWIELNEAFAAQSLAVIKEMEMDMEKVNPLGGAIGLGHPLGATGTKLTATLLHAMKRHDIKYGMVTMCVALGMGAAAIFELA